MKKILTLLLFFSSICTLISCEGDQMDFNPMNKISPTEAEAFKYSIVRYVGRLPKYAHQQNKFEPKFDEEYRHNAQKLSLDKYYAPSKDSVYFEISQLAPSFQKKKTATGGLVVFQDGNISYYKEFYRTWKMSDSLLAVRTAAFFPDMIKGKDLSPYYTEHIKDDTHIEFPSKMVTFDTDSRSWTVQAGLAHQP